MPVGQSYDANMVLMWSACKQSVYFNKRSNIICWADKEGEWELGYGCDFKAETEIMLCLHHYRRIFGHDPKE